MELNFNSDKFDIFFQLKYISFVFATRTPKNNKKTSYIVDN